MMLTMATNDKRMILSTLWIFVTLNYLYADVLVLLGEVTVTEPEQVEMVNALTGPAMLVVTAVYLELAMVMVVLSRLLNHGTNRWANIVMGTLQAVGASASLLVVTPPAFYVFFVVVEVIALLTIVRCAWTWKDSSPAGFTA